MNTKGRCIHVDEGKILIEDMGDGFAIEEADAKGEKNVSTRPYERYRIFYHVFQYAVKMMDENRRLKDQVKAAALTNERLQKELAEMDQKVPS